jgi:hypothetical protein
VTAVHPDTCQHPVRRRALRARPARVTLGRAYGKIAELPTVGAMALELLEHTRLRRKFSTGVFYGLMLEKHIVPALGMLRLTEVTSERIDKFAKLLAAGRMSGAMPRSS